MDEEQRKEESSLPPGYVSLAQLQERWLQRQQEKNLKGEKEEEIKGRGSGARNENRNHGALKNGGDKRMAGGLLRDAPQRRVEKGGREMGETEVKGKGKEIAIGGLENGEAGEKKKKKKKKKKRQKNKSAENGAEKEKTGGDRCEEVEIIPRDEVKMGIPGGLSGESSCREGIYDEMKGIQEGASVSMVAVLPTNGVRAETPNAERRGHRSGRRRNGDNKGFGYGSAKGYEVKLDVLKESGEKLTSVKKMEGDKGYGKKVRGTRKISVNRDSCYRSKDSRVDVLKVNEMERESERKMEDEILDVFGEMSDLNGRDGNEFWGHNNNGRDKNKEPRVEEESVSNHRVALEKKVGDELLVEERPKNAEKGGVRNGFRIRGNRRENGGRFWGPTSNDRGGSYVRSRVELNFCDGRRNGSSGRFGDRWKMEQIRGSGKVWVKKGKEDTPDADAAETGSLEFQQNSGN